MVGAGSEVMTMKLVVYGAGDGGSRSSFMQADDQASRGSWSGPPFPQTPPANVMRARTLHCIPHVCVRVDITQFVGVSLVRVSSI